MSNDNIKNVFLDTAIRLAANHSANGKNGPFGAVITLNDEVIAEGWNQVVETNDPSAHAEVVAIRKACSLLGSHSLAGCTLYSSCEPCPMCLSTAVWARLDRIVYAETRQNAAKAGFDDERIYQAFELKNLDKIIPREHMPTQAASDVFKAWKNNPSKKEY